MTNGEIVYTTKEMLARLDEKLDRIDSKLDMKADRERVHDLANAIARIELRAATRAELPTHVLELRQQVGALQAWRNRLAGSVAVIAVFAGVLAAKVLGAV